MDQAVDRYAGAALAVNLPQRNVGAAEVSGQWSQTGGSRNGASNPQLAHPAHDPGYNTQAVAAGFYSDRWLASSPPTRQDRNLPSHRVPERR